MLVWRASGLTKVTIRAWFGNNETGLLDAFKRVPGPDLLLGSNTPGQRLECELSPDAATVPLALRAFATSVAAADLPVFLEVRQDGEVLAADNGTGPPPTNGAGPFTEVQLTPDAKHNAPTNYYFYVSFS